METLNNKMLNMKVHNSTMCKVYFYRMPKYAWSWTQPQQGVCPYGNPVAVKAWHEAVYSSSATQKRHTLDQISRQATKHG